MTPVFAICPRFCYTNRPMALKTRKHSIVEPTCEVDKIAINDNGEALVSIEKGCPDVLLKNEPDLSGGPRLFFLRESLIEMLNQASRALPSGYKLRVWSAYRTFEYQVFIYNDVMQRFREQHPDWPFNILRRETNRFVHPPHIKTPPGHCTGGAVDLTVIGPNGEELDMTSPYGSEREEMRHVAATLDPKLTPQARSNRKILIDAMTRAHFTNYAGEWWHWSYGDSCWAWRVGRKTAIYGIAEPTAEILKIIRSHQPVSTHSS